MASMWYDPTKLAAAQAALPAGTRFIDGQSMLGALNPLSGVSAQGAGSVIPGMMNGADAPARPDTYQPGNYTLANGQTLNGNLTDYLSPQGMNLPSSDAASYQAFQNQLLTKYGLDPTKRYGVANLGDTPGGNAGKDIGSALYQINPDGTATPISARNNYLPSSWVGSGRDFVKAVGAMALGGAAISAAGVGAAGGAAGAGNAGAAGTAGAAGAGTTAGTASGLGGYTGFGTGAVDFGAGTGATLGGGTAGLSSAAPSLLGSMGSGALKGALLNGGSTALQGGNMGDVLKSAAIGGVTGGIGGGVASYNPAGAVGITNPGLQTVANGAVTGGLNAAVTGGNVGSGIAGGAIGGATSVGSGMVKDGIGSLTGSNMTDPNSFGSGAYNFLSAVTPAIASAFQAQTGTTPQAAASSGDPNMLQLLQQMVVQGSAIGANAQQYNTINRSLGQSQNASTASAAVAAQEAQQAAQQRDLYNQSVAPATTQIGLNALGAQNLTAAQTVRLQQLQQTLANPATPAADKASAQAELQGLQKTAESAGIGLENAKAAAINTVAQGQGANAQALGETNAQALLANANTSAGALNAAGDARRADQGGFYNTMAQSVKDIAAQRAKDFELKQTTKGNADIETAAADANRNLLRLGGDPNRMAAMSADIANNQQLARIGNGNQIGATNIANLNAADDASRALQTTGFNAETAAQYGLQDQAMGIKSTALDAARASRTAAAQTAQGIVNTGQNAAVGITNNAKDKVNAGMNSLQAGAAGLGMGLSNSSTYAANGTYAAGNSINNGLYSQGVASGEQAKAVGGMAGAGSTINANGVGQAATGLSGLVGSVGNLFKSSTPASPPSASSGGYTMDPNAALYGGSPSSAPSLGTSTFDFGSGTTPGQASFGSGTPYDFSLSSRTVKTNINSLNDEKVLDGLAAVQPKAWNYKPGVADGGRHIGPIAEDMNKQFGNVVAPGGKKIDPRSELGLHHAAINALTKRVKALEARN